MPHYPTEIEYSDKYNDDSYEYRNVFLTKAALQEMYQATQGKRLMSDDEWRGLGVQQSLGWEHYKLNLREPHILLFRKPLGTTPTTFWLERREAVVKSEVEANRKSEEEEDAKMKAEVEAKRNSEEKEKDEAEKKTTDEKANEEGKVGDEAKIEEASSELEKKENEEATKRAHEDAKMETETTAKRNIEDETTKKAEEDAKTKNKAEAKINSEEKEKDEAEKKKTDEKANEEGKVGDEAKIEEGDGEKEKEKRVNKSILDPEKTDPVNLYEKVDEGNEKEETKIGSTVNPEKDAALPNFCLNVVPDNLNFTLTIEDSGVGMAKHELINYLGRIIKSGHEVFTEALDAGGNISMIDQFGVGFLAVYLISDMVHVVSKNDYDELQVWESVSGGRFTRLKDIPLPFEMVHGNVERGNNLILFLEDHQFELSEERRLKDCVKATSEAIGIPVGVNVEKPTEK